MTTYSALTTVPGHDAAEALAEALEDLDPAPTGVGVIEIEDGSGLWEVGAYFIERPDGVALDLLAAVHGARAFVVSEMPETDWVAHVRRELAPVEAGRFFVYGSHDADKVPQGRIALLIEAAMAFGTGHHGTTLGCLRALDRLADQGVTCSRVADIGCGTAVLAMAAAHLARGPGHGQRHRSGRGRGCGGQCRRPTGWRIGVICVEAAGFDAPEFAGAAPFDLVFANILKGPLIALAPDMARNTAPGGYAILSGLLNEQAAEILAVYSRHGFNTVHHEEIVDWSTLTLQRK